MNYKYICKAFISIVSILQETGNNLFIAELFFCLFPVSTFLLANSGQRKSELTTKYQTVLGTVSLQLPTAHYYYLWRNWGTEVTRELCKITICRVDVLTILIEGTREETSLLNFTSKQPLLYPGKLSQNKYFRTCT